MKPERIQLSRKKGWRLPAKTVVVSRPSKWGNPWRVAKRLPAMLGMMEVPDQAEAVSRFKEDIKEWRMDGKSFEEAVKIHLRGKNLACWCKIGTPCHADVLLEIANRP